MPAPGCQSISAVYAAFDAASLGVFRAAMARSRGGVVRVADLLAALAVAEPGPARARLSEGGWRLAQQPPGPGPAPVPLANEPAVRAVLFRALDRAAALVPPRITPGVLLDVLLDVHPHLSGRGASHPPPAVVARQGPPPRRPAESEAFGHAGLGDVLAQWLAYQTATAATRDQELQRLQERLHDL